MLSVIKYVESDPPDLIVFKDNLKDNESAIKFIVEQEKDLYVNNCDCDRDDPMLEDLEEDFIISYEENYTEVKIEEANYYYLILRNKELTTCALMHKIINEINESREPHERKPFHEFLRDGNPLNS